MVFALLPVKAPALAKQRLSAVLSPAEREQLARLMFTQALNVLLRVRGLERVVVASSDPATLGEAEAAGALPLAEGVQHSHSFSAEWAARRCAQMGAQALLLAPIDVPAMQCGEVEELLAAGRAMPNPGLVIVPSADGTGTNALVLTPPEAMGCSFGPGSYQRHVAQARARGLAVTTLRPAGLVFDLDTPDDLAEFLARAPAGPVADFLRDCKGIRTAETRSARR
jgi:2-phospho-L-lactate guanylyltransferase